MYIFSVLNEFSDFDLYLLGEFLHYAVDPSGLNGSWGKYDFDQFLTASNTTGTVTLVNIIFFIYIIIVLAGIWNTWNLKPYVENYCQQVTCAYILDKWMTIYMLFIQYFQRYCYLHTKRVTYITSDIK